MGEQIRSVYKLFGVKIRHKAYTKQKRVLVSRFFGLDMQLFMT